MTRKNNYLKNLFIQYSYDHRRTNQKLSQARTVLGEIAKMMERIEGKDREKDEK